MCSLDDEYIGWKAYGRLLQVAAVGLKMTWPNWLATLAVIEPCCPEDRSTMSTRKPSLVSCILTMRSSPEFMNRSVAGFGVNVAFVDSNGSAGACDLPFLVMNAKFTGSIPALARQSALLLTPWFWSSDRLSTLSAAHHFVASQEVPGGHATQPGG